jgi:hypothetical protein
VNLKCPREAGNEKMSVYKNKCTWSSMHAGSDPNDAHGWCDLVVCTKEGMNWNTYSLLLLCRKRFVG